MLIYRGGNLSRAAQRGARDGRHPRQARNENEMKPKAHGGMRNSSSAFKGGRQSCIKLSDLRGNASLNKNIVGIDGVANTRAGWAIKAKSKIKIAGSNQTSGEELITA